MNEPNLSDDALAELLTLTVEVNDYATVYRNHLGQLHRIHGPAVIWRGGSKHWYQNGHLHRIHGPAVIYSEGDVYWYQNGWLHREDGPAVIYHDGRKHWYLNGEHLRERVWNERVKSI